VAAVLPNSWDIDAAVIGALQADSALLALTPDGVFYDLAPPGAKRFVIVSLIDPTDTSEFGRRTMESNLYLVEARGLSTVFTTANAKAAAARIDAILQDQPLTIPGYAWLDTSRDDNQARTRVVEPDAIDPSLRWLRGGGFYRVRASLT
jgi:hypothetical protein